VHTSHVSTNMLLNSKLPGTQTKAAAMHKLHQSLQLKQLFTSGQLTLTHSSTPDRLMQLERCCAAADFDRVPHHTAGLNHP